MSSHSVDLEFWFAVNAGHLLMILNSSLQMKPNPDGVSRAQKSRDFQGERPNWILIAAGALLSTLSIHLGYKLKQTLNTKQQENARVSSKGRVICIAIVNFPLRCLLLTVKVVYYSENGKPSNRRKTAASHLHSNVYSFTREDDDCFNFISGVI